MGDMISTLSDFFRMLHFVVGAAEPTGLGVLLAVLLVRINGDCWRSSRKEGAAGENNERTDAFCGRKRSLLLGPIFKIGF